MHLIKLKFGFGKTTDRHVSSLLTCVSGIAILGTAGRGDTSGILFGPEFRKFKVLNEGVILSNFIETKGKAILTFKFVLKSLEVLGKEIILKIQIVHFSPKHALRAFTHVHRWARAHMLQAQCVPLPH